MGFSDTESDPPLENHVYAPAPLAMEGDRDIIETEANHSVNSPLVGNIHDQNHHHPTLIHDSQINCCVRLMFSLCGEPPHPLLQTDSQITVDEVSQLKQMYNSRLRCRSWVLFAMSVAMMILTIVWTSEGVSDQEIPVNIFAWLSTSLTMMASLMSLMCCCRGCSLQMWSPLLIAAAALHIVEIVFLGIAIADGYDGVGLAIALLVLGSITCVVELQQFPLISLAMWVNNLEPKYPSSAV
eukprot:TRINITY_DN7583_c0_g1_i1.p1 TRINITY_DN7583_c0_g1~~TRINITY_DN7583_c0_g1_i1.p1  ORF type:complete len:240 (+),score=28.95 TRINITY_DN7583_c0_g1_i1:55-774(+)